MKIRLRYFAALREALGDGGTLDVPDGARVGDVRSQLIAQSPAHAAALARGRAVRSALNQVLCDDDAVLSDGDELAFFPPVTGG